MRRKKLNKILPDFIEYLRDPEAFEDPGCGRVYDIALCASVIGACLDNLRQHGSAGHIERIVDHLEVEQQAVLSKICRALRDSDEISHRDS